MPCWRGPALYDDVASQAAITKWVAFYKTHRDILSSDIVHVRRADHHGIDAILHVNPKLQTKGLAMLFNPTSSAVNGSLPLSLYYTGLSTVANVTERGAGESMTLALARDYSVELPFSISARNVTWFTFG